MHAARRHQAHQMAGAAAGFERINKINQRLFVFEFAVSYGFVDLRQFLQHDPACAQVHVANLGIAHLPVRQSDLTCGRVQMRTWQVRDHRIPRRRFASARSPHPSRMQSTTGLGLFCVIASAFS